MNKASAVNILQAIRRQYGQNALNKEAVGPNDPEVTSWYERIFKAVKDEMSNRKKTKDTTTTSTGVPAASAAPAPSPEKPKDMPKKSAFGESLDNAVDAVEEDHLGADFVVSRGYSEPSRFTVNIWDMPYRKH